MTLVIYQGFLFALVQASSLYSRWPTPPTFRPAAACKYCVPDVPPANAVLSKKILLPPLLFITPFARESRKLERL